MHHINYYLSKFIIQVIFQGYSLENYKEVEIWIKNKKTETFIESIETNVKTSLAYYLHKSKVSKCIDKGETLIIHVKPRLWHLRHFYRVHKIYNRIT
jgi:hypothetical protein